VHCGFDNIRTIQTDNYQNKMINFQDNHLKSKYKYNTQKLEAINRASRQREKKKEEKKRQHKNKRT